MHVSSDRDPVEIRWRDSVLSVARIFLGEYSLHAEGILFLMDCVVGLEVTAGMIWPIHTCYVIGPLSKLRKEIGAWRTCGAYMYRPR